MKIGEAITQYEKTSGNEVLYVSISHDARITKTNPWVLSIGDSNVRAFSKEWSDVAHLNVLLNKSYQKVAVSAEVYQTYFAEKNWNTFSAREQLIFEENTLHIDHEDEVDKRGEYYTDKIVDNVVIELINPTSDKGYTFIGWRFENYTVINKNNEANIWTVDFYNGETLIAGKSLTFGDGTTSSAIVVDVDVTKVTKIVVTNLVVNGDSALATAIYSANTYTITYYSVSNPTRADGYADVNKKDRYVVLQTTTATYDQNYTVISAPVAPTGTTYGKWYFTELDMQFDAGVSFTPWQFETDVDVYADYSVNEYTIYYYEINDQSDNHTVFGVNKVENYEYVTQTSIPYGVEYQPRMKNDLQFLLPEGTDFGSWQINTSKLTSGEITSDGDHKKNVFTWLYDHDVYAYEYYVPISYAIYYYELTPDKTESYDITRINLGAYYSLVKTSSSVYGVNYEFPR